MTADQRLGEQLAHLERKLKSTQVRQLILMSIVTLMAIPLALLAREVTTNKPSNQERPPQDEKVKTLRVRSLQLVDDAGMTRANLSANEKGSFLSLLDERGGDCILLAATQVAPGITVHDHNSKVRIALWLSPAGPRLTLSDEYRKARIEQGVTAEGPALEVRDANEKTRVMLQVGTDSSLALADTAGLARAALKVSEAGPSLVLADTSGSPKLLVQTDSAGLPGIHLHDKNSIVGSFKLTDEGPVLGLSQKAGKSWAMIAAPDKAEPAVVVFSEKGNLTSLLSGGKLELRDTLKNSAELAVGKNGPGLDLSAGNGRGSASVAVFDGTPLFTLSDTIRGPAITAAVDKKEGAYIEVKGENREDGAKLMWNSGNGSGLEIYRKHRTTIDLKVLSKHAWMIVGDGKAGAEILQDDLGPRISIRGKDFRELWKAP